MKDIVDIISTLLPNVSPFDALIFFMLIFTRWLTMSITMPFLGGLLIPSSVRIGLAALLSALCFFLIVDKQQFSELHVITIVLLFLKEALLGFILGFLSSLIFYTYELIGELLDIARAASMSRLLVPEVKHQSSAMGVLLFQFSLVIFIAFGFHRDVIQTAVESFTTFPPLSLESSIFSPDLLSYSVSVLAVIFEAAFRFSFPIIVVCLLIDIAFGLMNRIAPQINAYFLSLPAKMLGGLVIVLLVLPFFMDDFVSHYQELSRFYKAYVNTVPPH